MEQPDQPRLLNEHDLSKSILPHGDANDQLD